MAGGFWGGHVSLRRDAGLVDWVAEARRAGLAITAKLAPSLRGAAQRRRRNPGGRQAPRGLPSRAEPALRPLILRDDGRAPVEQIIHAEAHGVAVGGGDDVAKGAGEARIAEVADDVVDVEVEIFGLDGPVRRHRPFDAAARGPAGLAARGGRGHAGERARTRPARAGAAARDHAYAGAVGRAVVEQHAAGRVEQRAVEGVAEAPAQAADLVDLDFAVGAAGRRGGR